MSESQVLADLKAVDNNKAKLMQLYSDELQAILNLYGGTMSDVPANPEHPAHKLQHKITILGRMK